MKMQLISLASCILFFCADLFAQAPPIEWQKTFGGSGDDYVNFGKIFTLSDGNYLIVGTTTSSDGDLETAGNKGCYDGFVAKFDASTNFIWIKTYGGSGDDILNGAV